MLKEEELRDERIPSGPPWHFRDFRDRNFPVSVKKMENKAGDEESMGSKRERMMQDGIRRPFITFVPLSCRRSERVWEKGVPEVKKALLGAKMAFPRCEKYHPKMFQT